MKYKRVSTKVTPTLKGRALLMAIDAGLVPEAQTADGYNIAPFMRFWNAFSPLLEQALDKPEDVPEVLHKERESGAGDGSGNV